MVHPLPSGDETARSLKSPLKVMPPEILMMIFKAGGSNQCPDDYEVPACEGVYTVDQMDRKAPKQVLDKLESLDSTCRGLRAATHRTARCVPAERKAENAGLLQAKRGCRGFPLVFKVLNLAFRCFVVFRCGSLMSLMSLMPPSALYFNHLANMTKSVMASKFKLSSFLCLPTLTRLSPTTRLYWLIHHVGKVSFDVPAPYATPALLKSSRLSAFVTGELN
jgi:hypothetical protein